MKKLFLKSLIVPSILTTVYILLDLCTQNDHNFGFMLISFLASTLFMFSIGAFFEYYFIPKRRRKLHNILNDLGFEKKNEDDTYCKTTNGYNCMIQYHYNLTLTKYGNKEGIYIWLMVPKDLDLSIQKKIRIYYDHIREVDGDLYKGNFHQYPMWITSDKINKLVMKDAKDLTAYINSKSTKNPSHS